MSLSTTDVLEVLQIYNEVKRRYPNNSDRTCLFLAVCIHIYSDVDVEELSIDCEYGGIIGVGNSCLEKWFNWAKPICVHAAFHDACGHMRTRYNKGPGYVYVIKFPLNSCLLGHITGIAFCIHLLIFHNNIYKRLLN